LGRLPVVDVLAGHPHFVRHTEAVWRAMPPEMRGAFYTTRALDPGLSELARNSRGGRGDLTLVCSYGDLVSATINDNGVNGRPVVFMEHGAGFTFADPTTGIAYSSYSGSPDRPQVALFLNPNEYVSRANARAHPSTPQVTIGTPAMDRWYNDPPTTPYQRGEAELPTVALSFHWDCALAPGTRSTYRHFHGKLDEVAHSEHWNFVGTAHPRMRVQASLEYNTLGVPFVENPDDILATADLLIFDATSFGYEFASLNRPVVVMNAPWYRDEPDDGIRFWQHIPGIQVDEPSDLHEAVLDALDDTLLVQHQRQAAIEAVYPYRGDAAARAVAAITEFGRTFG